ncbi:nucleobase:cation symporter-2 family protein [Paracoccus sp. NGMCC 1.201697]|uniref:Nucleobase:cation symporter-2 family protein n=1 Tax=Paracoccus broussonetiae subsp. drimophilus TaxID=3373869 RepID=A0ABW7LR90_9RHOB
MSGTLEAKAVVWEDERRKAGDAGKVSAAAAVPDPIEEMMPVPKLFALGLQHVMVMYAGAVAVPLLIGHSLNLTKDQVALLVSADLFCCGIVTLIQCLGIWKFGARLPVMMGISFTAVPIIIGIGSNPDLGMPGVFGAAIGSGVFTVIAAWFFGKWARFFPSVVTGTVMLVIGVSLMRVGINWAAGGNPTIRTAEGVVPNPAYGDPFALSVAALVLLTILLVTRFCRGFYANLAVLFGITLGFIVAIAAGRVDFQGVGDAHWVSIVTPFAFGVPVFNLSGTIALSLVMIVMMIEATGQFLAIGDMAGQKISEERLARGLRTDGIGNIIGGIFNTFTYTTYAQNVGLLQITGVLSRFVVAAGAVILILLGCLPKVAFISASIPSYVIGGAALVMFGMVSATGVKILARVDFVQNRRNIYIVAVSLALSMIPLIAPTMFDRTPKFIQEIFHSGILVGTFSALLLNLLFNGIPQRETEIADRVH